MARYALAQHVFICLNGDHLVILDLKEDRYWALPLAQTNGVATLVSGWPVPADAGAMDRSGASEASSPETGAAIEILRERGILVAAEAGGKDATPITAIAPA